MIKLVASVWVTLLTGQRRPYLLSWLLCGRSRRSNIRNVVGRSWDIMGCGGTGGVLIHRRIMGVDFWSVVRRIVVVTSVVGSTVTCCGKCFLFQRLVFFVRRLCEHVLVQVFHFFVSFLR